VRYTVRPISDRTAFTGRHKPTPFASSWSATEELLFRELRQLAARDVVLELDFLEGQIRLDGRPYSNARAASSAVRIAFESKHGPLTYATDVFPTWQDNVRAIALSLEALRRVDRYGVVKRGEQYAGFKALPAGRAMPASHMTRDDAIALLADQHGYPTEYYAAEPSELRTAWKFARAAAHPDRNGGDRTLWDQVEQAAAVLGVAS
jgi:hypothetical protein